MTQQQAEGEDLNTGDGQQVGIQEGQISYNEMGAEQN